MEINTYPWCIKHRSNLGHIFREKVRLIVRDIRYLPLAYKMHVEFRSHFSRKIVRLMVREIWYFNIMSSGMLWY